MVRNNGDAYARYASLLQERFGIIEPAEIAAQNFVSFYSLAVPKAIVSKALEKGWSVDPSFAGLHERVRKDADGKPVDSYSMLSWVGRFTRTGGVTQELGRRDTPQIAEYARAIGQTTLVPGDVDYLAGRAVQEVDSDLQSVVALRQAFGGR